VPSSEVDLLRVEGVFKRFEVKASPLKKVVVHALNGVSVSIGRGKTLALVGESGCGKTTLGKTVLGLHPPDEGRIYFKDREIGDLKPRRRGEVQKEMRMIFQDPYASLNPRHKIRTILERPLKMFTSLDGAGRRERVEETCEQVGLDPSYLQRYPHQFSGGQRQRVAIARAIILNPSLVVADEPVSALDVSIQAQILNLMMDLQDRYGLAYLFITHDIGVVRHLSDFVGVMYLGVIVEYADKGALFRTPLHPYTRLLFSAVPDIHKPFSEEAARMTGEIPSPTDLPPGCFFAPRCPLREEECVRAMPDLAEAEPGHWVRCARNDSGASLHP